MRGAGTAPRIAVSGAAVGGVVSAARAGVVGVSGVVESAAAAADRAVAVSVTVLVAVRVSVTVVVAGAASLVDSVPPEIAAPIPHDASSANAPPTTAAHFFPRPVGAGSVGSDLG